jgi:hypothetical protein
MAGARTGHPREAAGMGDPLVRPDLGARGVLVVAARIHRLALVLFSPCIFRTPGPTTMSTSQD